MRFTDTEGVRVSYLLFWTFSEAQKADMPSNSELKVLAYLYPLKLPSLEYT
jgi:hypothetical protein